MAITDTGEYLDPMMIGEQQSLFTDILDSMPGVLTTSMWNVSRVRNTIIGGPTGRYIGRVPGFGGIVNRAGRGTGGMIRQGTMQTFGPRHVRRFTRAANIDPSFYGESTRMYSPFNILSSMGNKAWGLKNRIAKTPIVGENLAAKMASLAGDAPAVEGEKMFSPGTLGRIRTFGSITNMSEKRFIKSMDNIRNAIHDINPEVGRQFSDSYAGYLMSDASNDIGSRYAMRSGLGETITGRVSGRVAGYIQGAEAFGRGTSAVSGARSTLVAGSHFSRGVELGIEAAEKGTTLGKIASSGAISTGLKAANVVGWVMLAHDLAQVGGKLIGRSINFAVDAAKSVQGDINKPIMGMGFRDNTVAATSRQRGVMAIQNSRLNMRSYLG